MATITTDTFLDDGTARTAGEGWTLNGGKLTVRTDTRWHANAPASMTGSLGSMTVSALLGGGVLFDGRNVRWLPYASGSGNVPAIGTIVTQGLVSGYLLGVYDTITSAPTAVGSPMPVNGHIKFREVTGGVFSVGALTGIGASATSPDVTGWIEIVQDENAMNTSSRLGSGFQSRGDWFYLDDTNGSIGQILQVPTNGGGAATWCPGVWIETAPGSDEYVFWPGLEAVSTSWSHLNIGAPVGATDIRQQFVKTIGSGQMQIGESFTQASTYAVTTQASTYSWAGNFVTVTFTAHGYSVGEQVYLDFTSGGATADGVYTIFDVPTANTYRVALSGSGASGNVTSCGRVTITFTAHGQTTSKLLYLDVTSGGLPDGIYEIRGTPAANTYTIAAAVSPATVAGNVTVSLTIGHIPVAGCKTRIPNVIQRACTTGARATNTKPNVTTSTRPEFTTTGAGVIDFEYLYSDWYMAFTQPYALTVKHSAFWDRLYITECATPFVVDDVGIGTIHSASVACLSVLTCLAGGTIDNFVGGRVSAPANNQPAGDIAQSNNLTFTNCLFSIPPYSRAGTGEAVRLGSSRNIKFNGCTTINHGIAINNSFNVEVKDHSYSDRHIGYTNASGIYPINIGVKSADVLVDGLTFGVRGVPLERVHSYNAPIALNSVERVRVRNFGSLTTPINSTTKGVLAMEKMVFLSGANLDVKIQNVHIGLNRTGVHAFLNVDKNVTLEKCSSGRLTTFLQQGNYIISALNARSRGIRHDAAGPGITANASVYGTHFEDVFQTDTRGYVKLSLNEPTAETNSLVIQNGTPKFTSTPSLVMSDSDDEVIVEMDYYAQGHTGFLGAEDRALLPSLTGMPSVSGAVAYTWAADVVTCTQTAHGFKTGDWVWVNPIGGGLLSGRTYNKPYQITVTGANTYTFAQTGSGASGNLNVWYAVKVEYQIDKNVGTGYNGTWKNLVLPKYAPQITSASAVVTMNSTDGLAVNDYVWSSTIADFASGTRIQSIDSATQITLTSNATATSALRILYFSQLPNETIDPTDGFKMKWRITPVIPHSLSAITYIHAFTSSTLAAQQAISYPLDTFTLTLTGLKNPTEVRVFDAGTTTEIAGQETITSGTFTGEIDAGAYPTVDISILALGYQNTRLTNIDMSAGNVSIPVQQIIDRQYENV